ncbi:hypothetical protein AVEN_126818-1 [Araneus ventricosus]|uniref:Uncharacterized protein n=1 Tax=Araneus ventricosus TaxID=182803 RepID=A0A4Y2DVT4_ARAVE|nr:hypothetical protein AVEN_126818-1 [Araneus ventricosus]
MGSGIGSGYMMGPSGVSGSRVLPHTYGSGTVGLGGRGKTDEWMDAGRVVMALEYRYMETSLLIGELYAPGHKHFIGLMFHPEDRLVTYKIGSIHQGHFLLARFHNTPQLRLLRLAWPGLCTQTYRALPEVCSPYSHCE